MKVNVLSMLLGTLCLFGCGSGKEGPALYPVAGEVTLNGTPLPEGDIIFRPADGSGHSYAGKIVDGKFTVEVEAGKKTVEITARQEIPGKTREDNPGEIVTETQQVVPEKYNVNTELTADVSADMAALQFTLEGDPPKAQ